MQTATTLIRPLAEGPLDIIGDIHGEIEALEALLKHLGYRDDGSHPENRHLVFVGDLCDRGPDSPAVIFKVRNLVESGCAQCVLGNHEFNLLRQETKHGNHWFMVKDDEAYAHHVEQFGPSVRVESHHESQILDFFYSLPVALERADLRIVHAAWDSVAIERLRTRTGPAHILYDTFDKELECSPRYLSLKVAGEAEKAIYKDAIRDKSTNPPFLHAHAAWEEFQQCENPIRVLTSGIEKVTETPFFASGQWRFVERVKWWRDYTEAPAVVFGHYWRWWNAAARGDFSKGEPDLFEGEHPEGWYRNKDGREVAFCVDYSVGARFSERKHGRTAPFHGRLAALRWPERVVMFDHDPPRPRRWVGQVVDNLNRNVRNESEP